MPDDPENPEQPPEESAPPSSGRYVVQESIGHGGMGQVFRAWDQNLGRQVAVKRISQEAGVDAAIRREAGILAALHHPNIVTIFDFADDELGPFVVMELVEGRNLEELILGQPFDVPNFLELVSQVCRGLSSAHAAGLLHLDLKPGNIMLQLHKDGSFTSKILDFGLARAREEEAETQGEILGSPYTVAPEQLAHEPVDVRTDIYALGCVFYFALSGKNPFEAPTIDEILQRHMQGDTKPLHLIAPKVPPGMSQTIARMLDVDPAKRPQSVEEARKELFKFSRAPAPAQSAAPTAHRPGKVRSPVGGSGGTYAPPAAGAPARAEGGGGMFIVLAFLVLAGAGAWWQFGSRQPAANEDADTPPPGQSVAPAVAEASKPVLDPTDTVALNQHMGKSVVIEGTIESAMPSGLFHAEFLRFAGVSEDGVVASVRADVMEEEQAKSFVGKRVRATGKLSGAAGVKRVVVESAADLSVAGP